MWERLGCRQIDASVISRVIKGERLFTAAQLKAFCTLLALPKQDDDYLFACLQEDYNAKLSLPRGTAHISSSLTKQLIEELTTNAFDLFYQGNYDALEKRYDLVQQLSGAYLLGNHSKKIDELLGLNLYIKGRTMANGALPGQVTGKVLPVFNQLLAISKISQSTMLYGYAHVLLSNTYYLAGGYSEATTKHKFYVSSIKLAKIAIDSLPEDDNERLFALRLIAASAGYIHDQDTLLYILKKTKQTIPRQPRGNYINALHLSMSLSKSLVTSHMADPFFIREYATNHFKRNLSNTGVYEVSGIKEEIEALLHLKTQEKTYIRDKIQQGMHLANEYNFSRQKKYFNKLLRTL
jgi:hypothetical protein